MSLPHHVHNLQLQWRTSDVKSLFAQWHVIFLIFCYSNWKCLHEFSHGCKNPIFNPVRTICPDRCTTMCQTLKLKVNPLCHTLSEQVTSFKLPESHLYKLLGVSWHHACCCYMCASIHNFVKTELTPTKLNKSINYACFWLTLWKLTLCMFWNRRRFRCVLKGISFLGNYNKCSVSDLQKPGYSLP